MEPLPELTVLREFWLPCGVRLPSVRLGACVLLWWDEAGDGGTSPSPLDTEEEEEMEEEGERGQGDDMLNKALVLNL